jgi:hypothetical protein
MIKLFIINILYIKFINNLYKPLNMYIINNKYFYYI